MAMKHPRQHHKAAAKKRRELDSKLKKAKKARRLTLSKKK